MVKEIVTCNDSEKICFISRPCDNEIVVEISDIMNACDFKIFSLNPNDIRQLIEWLKVEVELIEK